MNKVELVKAIGEKAEGITKKDIEAILSTFVDVVEDTVATGEKVTLVGFGTFERRETKASEGVMNGKAWTKDAGFAPKFKAGKEFKDKVEVK